MPGPCMRPFALITRAAFSVEGVWLIVEGPIRPLVNQARLAVMAALTRPGAARVGSRSQDGTLTSALLLLLL
jgi:hypothetical protein